MTNKGNLFLIPSAIAVCDQELIVPPAVKKRLGDIRHFLAEDIRTARRYLANLKIYETVGSLSFSLLNKDTKEDEMPALFDPVFSGNHLGVLSDSGCPGIADPGAIAVKFAHQHGVKVIPLVGPSSIFLSLMASGLNGQRFAFHGYLPVRGAEATKAIQELEKESRNKNQTQIFIETPYRNNTLFANLVRNLRPETQLCLAIDVTGDQEFILTQSVKKWRIRMVELPKNPAVFLFLA